MRARIHDILEMSDTKDPFCRIFSLFIVSLILLNVVCIVLESMDEIERQYRDLFWSIEIGSTLVFA
ncbi:MAG: ion transporter, partial [Betaproteobacteria bacterium]